MSLPGTVLKAAVMNSATNSIAYWVHDIDPYILRFSGDVGLRLS